MTDHRDGAATKSYAGLARTWARNAVLQMVREMGGRIVCRPVFRSRSDLDMSITDAEPMGGLRAAVSLMRVAKSFSLDYVRQAREEGFSWQAIGEAVELPGRADRHQPVAYADFGFGFATHGQARPSITWTCPACHSTVVDHGPDVVSPEDGEVGHADDCARLASAMAAWRASWEDEAE